MFSKNRGTPKWMVKIMETPINPNSMAFYQSSRKFSGGDRPPPTLAVWLRGEYLRWLEADLKAARAAGKKWIIAGGHRPLVPCWQSTREKSQMRVQIPSFFSTDFD